MQNSLRYSREYGRVGSDCIYSLDAKCTKWEHKGKNPLNEGGVKIEMGLKTTAVGSADQGELCYSAFCRS